MFGMCNVYIVQFLISRFSIIIIYYKLILLQKRKHKLETGENTDDKVVLSDSEEHEG